MSWIASCLQCEHVSSKTWKTNKGLFGTFKDLLEFGRYSHELLAETLVCSDGDTVLSHHGYHRATIVLHNRLGKGVNQSSSAVALVHFSFYRTMVANVLLFQKVWKRKKGEWDNV